MSGNPLQRVGMAVVSSQWFVLVFRYAPALGYPISRLSGEDWSLWLAGGLFGTYLALSLGRLGRAARMIAVLSLLAFPVLLLVTDASRGQAEAALGPALFLVTFLTVFDLVRSVAARSPLVSAAGREMLSQPPGRRYVAVSLGSMTLSIVLLLGVVGLVGSMAMSGAAGRLDHSRQQILIAMMRGYQLMPAWSPVSMPFAVVVAAFPMVDWALIAVITVPLCVAMWGIGWWLRERTLPKSETTDPPASRSGALLRLGASLGSLLLAIFVVSGLFGIRLVDAVLLIGPAFAAIWWLVQATCGGQVPVAEASAGQRSGDNELVIVSGAAFIASMTAPFIPSELLTESLVSGSIPIWAVPPAMVIIIIAVGQIAAPPVFAILLFAAALPDPHSAGLSPHLVAASCLAAWGLAAMASPFNPVTLTLERITGVPSRVIAHDWNRRYVLVAMLLLILASSLLTF